MFYISLPLSGILNRCSRDKSARQRDIYNLKYVSNSVTVLTISQTRYNTRYVMRLCTFRRVTSGRQNCRLSNFHLNKRVNWTSCVIFTQSARLREKERRMNKKRICVGAMIELSLSSRDFVHKRIDSRKSKVRKEKERCAVAQFAFRN